MRLIDVEPIIRELQDEEQYGADYYLPIELLKSAPTIEAKPVVHAHFIEHMEFDYEGGYSGSSYSCSNCNEVNYYDDIKDFKYCPYCGAQMDEDASDNNVGSKGVKIPVISMEDVPKIMEEMEK